MPKKGRLKLAGGAFVRDEKEEAEPLTADYCIERAMVCLEEAARSQSPLNAEFTRQAEVWFQLGDSLKQGA